MLVRYTDAFGTERRVSDETLLGVLRARGDDLSRPGDASATLTRLEAAGETAPPVVVAWEGLLGPVRTPPGTSEVRLALEAGGEAAAELRSDDGRSPGSVSCRSTLPFGLHRLRMLARRGAGRQQPAETLVIAAPFRSPALEARSWGVFAPTYALRDERHLPAGDLSCLGRAARLTGRLGGSYLATLPLLADYSSHDVPGWRVSPYSPLSRMWWNEAFVDPALVPELEGADGIGGGSRESAAAGRTGADVGAAGARLRPLLDLGASRLMSGDGERRRRLERFSAERPDVVRYGRFRAAAETAGPDPAKWPPAWAAGRLTAGDVPAEAVRAHIYAQWVTDEQIGAVAAESERAGCRLLLDLPIGCRPGGYDPWAYPGSFAGGAGSPTGDGPAATVGAPPDMFFPTGQDWGFRPLDPDGERRAGYPVVRSCLAHLLAHAGALRVDHVMGLSRLWWIPAGAPPSGGAYVRYPAEELLALSCLEAYRHGAALLGEDLGTVEPGLRRLLAAHGIAGMDVAVFDLDARPGRPLRPPAGTVAFVDTHDTATFAGWLDATDLDDRRRAGLLDEADAVAAVARRVTSRGRLIRRLHRTGRLPDPPGRGAPGPDAVEVLGAVLDELGDSEAAVVVANLEDLWAEHDPQNVPGTVDEHANFSRRMSRTLGELESNPQLLVPLERLDAARRRDVAGTGR